MARINTEKKRLIITHPVFEDFKVHCRKLEPIEFMDLFSGFQKYQKSVAILHPVSGELIKNEETGALETQVVTNLPPSAVIDILHNVIENWEGLEDSKGTINYSRENIKHLFNRDLNVKIKVKKTVKGVEQEVEESQSFADYIQDQINKDVEETQKKDADLLPKTKASPKRV